MAKGAFVGVDGRARKIKKIYVGITEKARSVSKAYVGINGKARLFYLKNVPSSLELVKSIARGKKNQIYGQGGASNLQYAIFSGGTVYQYGAQNSTAAYDSSMVEHNASNIEKATAYLKGASTDDFAFMAGGEDSNAVCAFSQDLSRTRCPNLKVNTASHASGSFPGHVIFAGGYDGGSPLKYTYAYATNLTSVGINMISSARRNLGSVSTGEKVIFAGGLGTVSGKPNQATDTVDWYNPALVLARGNSLSTKAKFCYGAMAGSGYSVFGTETETVTCFTPSLSRVLVAPQAIRRAFVVSVSLDGLAIFAGSSNLEIYNENLVLSHQKVDTNNMIGRDIAATTLGNLAFYSGGNLAGNFVSVYKKTKL